MANSVTSSTSNQSMDAAWRPVVTGEVIGGVGTDALPGTSENACLIDPVQATGIQPVFVPKGAFVGESHSPRLAGTITRLSLASRTSARVGVAHTE